MFEENIEETFDHWNDEKFVAELQSRTNDYKTGKIKGITWEDAKKQILTTNKSVKNIFKNEIFCQWFILFAFCLL